MLKKISNYFYAIIHLKPIQVIYRLFYLLKKNKANKIKLLPKKSYQLVMTDSINSYSSYRDKNTFSFLNQSYQFHEKIDWNYIGFGMLWTYNLNYFEFLAQDTFDRETGQVLINDYIEQYQDIHIGYDSYPISLRNIFWIRFLVKYKIHDEKIDAFLYDTYKILLQNLEYHLLGNHLLENAFSLLIGAYYFHDTMLYNKAYKLLKTELEEQILNDGGHFELSPMYHQILLYRLLDCINIVSNNKWKEDDLLRFMHKIASIMLSWLKNMTFPSGAIPFLNDTSGNIAPSSGELFDYAEQLCIRYDSIPLSDSNYRIFRNDRYAFICDIDGISPAYQCGHAHADTFNFVMEVDGRPLFVDTGCSTYQTGRIRIFERGTLAHNTVTVNGDNSSHVWASHRVGKRARVTVLEDSPHCIMAQHNGCGNKIHSRTFIQKNDYIEIIDEIKGIKNDSKNVALFHLDNSIKNISIQGNKVIISDIKLVFDGASNLNIVDYEQAIGFNKKVSAKYICVDFDKKLKTKINFFN